MPLDYWSGLVSGFQDRREKAMMDNYARELQNRQMADRVFGQLLASRDPVIQELALSGLMNPMAKKKGFAGFLGEYESNPVLGQIVAAMNQIVPDTSSAPAPPATPGGAAMSTNQPVRPGSAPIPATPPAPPRLDPGAADVTPEMAGGMQPAGPVPGAMPQGASIPFPPAPPPESKWKRRGTGIPTAEEVAEMQARIPLETRIVMAQQYLPPDAAQQAILGIMGAPQRLQVPSAMTQWGVRVNGVVQPVIFDPSTKSFVLSGGAPLPPGAEMVRMSGAGGTTPRTAREPDPQFDTGWAKVFYDTMTGEELYRVQDVPFIPPAEGTTPILDAAGNPVVVTTPRVGQAGGGRVVGGAVNPQPSVEQSNAQALLADVRRRIQAAEAPRFPGQPVQRLTPQQVDQIVTQAATEAGLPYQRYYDLEQAARVPTARQVAPQPTAPPAAGPTVQPPASIADRIRERALRNRQQGGPAQGRGAPPARPPARQQGPGPRR